MSRRRPSRVKEGNLIPPTVGGKQTGPSTSSQAPLQRRTKRKRDDKAASESSLPKSFQSPSLLPRGASSRKSQRTMEQQDCSSHVRYCDPGSALPQVGNTIQSSSKNQFQGQNDQNYGVGMSRTHSGAQQGDVKNPSAMPVMLPAPRPMPRIIPESRMESSPPAFLERPIFLPSNSSGSGNTTDEGVTGQNDSPEDRGEEAYNKDEGEGGGSKKGSRPGTKPQLGVCIPGKKKFVPKIMTNITRKEKGGGQDESEEEASTLTAESGVLGPHFSEILRKYDETFQLFQLQRSKFLELGTQEDFPFEHMPGGTASGGGGDGGGASTMGGGHPEEKEHIEATLKAIERKGALSHTIVHGVFVGPARSGKNSLMENLLGSQIPSFKSPSTGVAEAVVQVQVEKLTTIAATVDKGSIWSRIDYNDEVIRLISIHSDPRNVQYEQQPNLTHETCARVRPFTPNPPKKHHSATPLEILTQAIDNKGLHALQKYFDTSWSLYLSNTGGQIEFQEILPLLVSGPCVFFYTFRLDRDLNEHYTIKYELQDGTKSELYKSSLTTIEGIQQSLASIAAMGIFVYQGREKKNVQLRPKVFFVGTHRDLLPSTLAECIITEKDQYLQESTSQFVDIIEFASSFQMIFAVNNFSRDKSAFQKIRSAVECAVERHEFEMVCPSHWLILSFALRRFDQEIVSYEECFKVAKQCGIVDKKELNDALNFIHTKMGLIRYFPHEYIKDIVVVKPQLLYDKISELIVKTFTFDKAGKPAAEQFEKGIFSLHEFERICRKTGEGSMKAPQFAKLLEKLRITAPLERDGDRVTKYFIPCVLAHATKAKEQLETQSLNIPPLVITFKCGYCPKGLGGALISYLMANTQSVLNWKLRTNYIFRDQVTFEVGPLDTVVLKILPTHLVVACIPNPKVQIRRGCHVDDICIEVRKVIEAGIKQVADDIDFMESEVEHSLTFLCPCINQHPAEMKYYEGEPYCLHCNKTEEYPELPQGYEKWFITKSQREGNSATIKESHFTQDQISVILSCLTQYAAKWRAIGTGLRFTQYELDNIENMPSLFFTAPTSMLHKMLSKWLQWAPGDSRGSTGFATVDTLIVALVKADLPDAAVYLSKALSST